MKDNSINKKLSKDEYYHQIAKSVASKSTCRTSLFGCIIVKEDQIISTGYVGAPRKVVDCLEIGYCLKKKKHIESGRGYEECRSVHAEQNAIINAARTGVSLLGGTMYLYGAKRKEDGEIFPIKAFPCLICKKMIINAGIERFVGNDENGKLFSREMKDWVRKWQEKRDISEDEEKYI